MLAPLTTSKLAESGTVENLAADSEPSIVLKVIEEGVISLTSSSSSCSSTKNQPAAVILPTLNQISKLAVSKLPISSAVSALIAQVVTHLGIITSILSSWNTLAKPSIVNS